MGPGWASTLTRDEAPECRSRSACASERRSAAMEWPWWSRERTHGQEGESKRKRKQTKGGGNKGGNRQKETARQFLSSTVSSTLLARNCVAPSFLPGPRTLHYRGVYC